MATTPIARNYRSFADLAAAQTEGTHFRVEVRSMPDSKVCIVAPHGGLIEAHTSSIARRIAAADHNYYLFEGIRGSGNYAALHLTSRFFDEPRCLELLKTCSMVVVVHGCGEPGRRVLLGGLDEALKLRVRQHLEASGLEADVDGHAFPGVEPTNICNRGDSGKGVQLELTLELRQSAVATTALVAAVRKALAEAILEEHAA